MIVSTSKRTTTVGAALAIGVLATALTYPTANAGAQTMCTPDSRTVNAPAGSLPAGLSPTGHVVTQLWHSDTAASQLSVYAPDGTVIDIVAGDRIPTGPADINGRGVVVGTDQILTGVGTGTVTFTYQPWLFRNGHVRDLATSGKLGDDVRKDYRVAAVNTWPAIVGLKTNVDRFAPSDPEYVARPVVWPSPRSTPIKLGMRPGFVVVSGGRPLLDILNDGTVTGVLQDAEGHRYLAAWPTPGGNPGLQRLPDAWLPTKLSGGWVAGRAGATADQVFVQSWSESFLIDGPQPLSATGVSSDGTFTVAWWDQTQSPTSFVGKRIRAVREIGAGAQARGVTSTFGGQVLIGRDNTTIEVVTCALQLPVASDFEVTPVDLP